VTAPGWRVMRQDAYGEWLAPMDYTDKNAAEKHIERGEQIGLKSVLQTFDPFTGQWTPPIKEQP